jgi:hypothetical protein
VSEGLTVVSETGHTRIATHHIDPDPNYWRSQQKTRPKAGVLCNR